ncbi:MAG: hypothetical protein ACR2GQ_09615 [Gemmatimonadota bacterium]
MKPVETRALEAWLGPRLDHAPAELAEAVRRLLEEALTITGEPGERLFGLARSPEDIPGTLAAAALRGFDGVVDCAEADQASRPAALRLLAADASLTYAFEAAADLGADVLDLAARAGAAGALGARLRARRAAPGSPAGSPEASPAAPDPSADGGVAS